MRHVAAVVVVIVDILFTMCNLVQNRCYKNEHRKTHKEELVLLTYRAWNSFLHKC